MKLYLIVYQLDVCKYMANVHRGEKDYQLVWANSIYEANAKLEKHLIPETFAGDDSYWLTIIETREAIQ